MADEAGNALTRHLAGYIALTSEAPLTRRYIFLAVFDQDRVSVRIDQHRTGRAGGGFIRLPFDCAQGRLQRAIAITRTSSGRGNVGGAFVPRPRPEKAKQEMFRLRST